MDLVQKYIADESGATAIEYALIISLVAVVAITGARLTLGKQMNDNYTYLSGILGG